MSKAALIARLKELESTAVEGGAPQAQKVSSQQNPAKRASSDSETRLRAILETAVDSIITIDECGRIESINPAGEKAFGYSAREIIGRNVNILMPSPYHEAHDGYIEKYLRTGEAKVIGIGRETVARRKDGTTFPIDLSVSEVRLARRRLFTGFIRDITERKRLEKEILEISDHEQRRIGQDLHDGLCQQLAGIELMSRALEQRIAAWSKADAVRAGEIAGHVRKAIRQTRLLARGLSPVILESEGVMSALQELASDTEKMFKVNCRFACDSPVPVRNQSVATHLFRIAQEAVSNAIKHGKATRILIRLARLRGRVVLEVADNGSGFPKNGPKHKGMGLRIMQSRAGMIAGTLTMENNPEGGARIICSAVLNTGSTQKTETRGRRKEKSKSQEADSHR